MEAMRANLPIVASNIKGHSDLLPSECLYTLNDEDAYVELIKKTRLGSENYDTEKYELDGVIDENMRLYLNFLEEDF